MEWVETTAKTVDEAVDQALDKLGVDEQEAEWEVLEEPRPGLFGRLRGQARVRARIRPRAQPAKDRRDRRRRDRVDGPDRSRRSPSAAALGGGAAPDGVAQTAPAGPERPGRRRRARPAPAQDDRSSEEQPMPSEHPPADPEEVAAQVESFLTGLVAAFGEQAPVVVDRTDDEVVGRIDAKLGLLIGPKGQTLEAIQELARVMVQRAAPSELRIKVDVGDYRAQRQQALERFARQVATKVRDTGRPVALEPMPPPDRKIIHDALAGEAGVVTHSDGDEPRRRVVVAPADGH